MDETSRKIEKVYGVLFLQSCCPHGPLFGPVTHDVFHFPTCFHIYSATPPLTWFTLHVYLTPVLKPLFILSF